MLFMELDKKIQYNIIYDAILDLYFYIFHEDEDVVAKLMNVECKDLEKEFYFDNPNLFIDNIKKLVNLSIRYLVVNDLLKEHKNILNYYTDFVYHDPKNLIEISFDYKSISNRLFYDYLLKITRGDIWEQYIKKDKDD